jgi:ABC-type uncharacterized transport system auxiliary subunit
MSPMSVIRFAAVAAGALSLSACALLSSPEPVQTYRFGAGLDAGAETAPGTVLKSVSLRRIEFPEAVEGDRILGVTGTETAYIKGARWVSRAQDLYTDSLESAFAGSNRVRLIGGRELIRGDRSLDLDVRSFEARYASPGATPTVVVVVRARLMTLPERAVAAERTFTVEQAAPENRVSAIVEAFDVATRDLNTQLVAWTEANAG